MTPEKIGTEFQVNTYTASHQLNPSVTSLSDGGFVVTWTSYGQDGSGSGVYGQRYTASGQASGNEFKINTYTSNTQSNPSVTSLSDGGFVVTWISYEQDGSGYGIYGQRYTSSGQVSGNEFQINTYTTDRQNEPSVTSLSDGGFVVTWTSQEQDGSPSGIYGQRYTSSGQASGNEFQISTDTTNTKWQSSVTSLSDGGFVVTWTSYGQDGSAQGIYGQRFTASGQASGNEFQINTYTKSDQGEPSVTSLSNGGFVVTWESFRQNVSENSTCFGIYGQRYNASGQASGNEFQINTDTAYCQTKPSATSLSDGGFVVTWESDGQDGSGYGIFGQRYDANGQPVGNEFQINTYTDNDQIRPSVTGLNDGRFIVTWTSYDQDGSDYGIFAQIFGTESQANTNTPPTYQEPDDFEYETGASLTISLDTIFSDADGDTLTYTVTNLPEGLTYNSVSKQIEGTLTADAGVYSFNVMADDGNGGSVSASFDLTVLDEIEVPVPTAIISVEEDAAEPNSEGQFILSLDQASSEDIVLDISISGSASRDEDYYILVTSGSASSEPGSDHSTLSYTTTSTSSLEVRIPAGATEATIHIIPLDDSSYEGSETVVATLNSVISGEATISSENSSATMVVTDDDEATPLHPDLRNLDLETDGTWTQTSNGWVLQGATFVEIGHSNGSSGMLRLKGGTYEILDGNLIASGVEAYSSLEGYADAHRLFSGQVQLNLLSLEAMVSEGAADTPSNTREHAWAGLAGYSYHAFKIEQTSINFSTQFDIFEPGQTDFFVNFGQFLGFQHRNLVLSDSDFSYTEDLALSNTVEGSLFGDRFAWNPSLSLGGFSDVDAIIDSKNDRIALKGKLDLQIPKIAGFGASVALDISDDKGFYFRNDYDEGFEWDIVGSGSLQTEFSIAKTAL